MPDVVEIPPGSVLSDAHVDELAGSVSRLVHLFNRARAHMLDSARYDVERSAQLLISLLVTRGPMRAGALAEQMQSDPSTISRQVASLVREGMVDRRADPEDGRASLLVATEKARAAHEHHLGHRHQHFRAMLADWDDGDCARLAGLVTRFTEDFEKYTTTSAAAGWDRPPSPEGRS
jgi:DNA-binding MarR family transcriptional regulator